MPAQLVGHADRNALFAALGIAPWDRISCVALTPSTAMRMIHPSQPACAAERFRAITSPGHIFPEGSPIPCPNLVPTSGNATVGPVAEPR